jgi:YD repeat-containing protein
LKDPRGVETKYTYDAFGRLQNRTYNNAVVEDYEYHYK